MRSLTLKIVSVYLVIFLFLMGIVGASNNPLRRYYVYNADLVPSSPSAYDDEGNGVGNDLTTFNTTLWTDFNPGSNLTKSVSKGQIILSASYAAGEKVCGVYHALPAGDWTIVTKVMIGREDIGSMAGILLIEDTSAPTTSDLYSFCYKTDYTWPCLRYTAYTALAATVVADTAQGHPDGQGTYLKLTKSSTTYTFQVSRSGVSGDWYTVFSSTLTFTPQAWGLGISPYANSSGNTEKATFEFFREYSSDPGTIGGMELRYAR